MLKERKIQISEPSIGEEEWLALKEPIMTGWVTSGPKVRAFEQMFAEKHKVKHAIAVTSCTTALHLALEALGVGPGDEVIVPAFTWVSTSNAVLYCGARPVFVDISLETFNSAEIFSKSGLQFSDIHDILTNLVKKGYFVKDKTNYNISEELEIFMNLDKYSTNKKCDFIGINYDEKEKAKYKVEDIVSFVGIKLFLNGFVVIKCQLIVIREE